METSTGLTEFTLSADAMASMEKACGSSRCEGTLGSFEVCLHRPALWGKIWAYIYEEDCPPTNIIRADKNWGVKICWEIYGNLVPFICGNWCLHLDFESIGEGPEFDLPLGGKEIKIPLNPCKCHYEYDFKVPKGTIKPEHCSSPYKVVATVTYLTSCRDEPGPMAGFVEFPVIQFYKANHD